MIWETIPIVLLLVVSGSLTLFYSFIFWRTRAITPGGIPLTVIMTAVTFWSWSSALGLSTQNTVLMIIARVIEYLAIAIIPVAFVQFSMLYSGRGWQYEALGWALVSVIPVFTGVLLAAVTIDPLISQVGYQQVNPYSLYAFTTFPVFWIFFSYATLLMLTGIIIIIQCYQSPIGIFRGQIACLLIAIIPPYFLYIAYVFHISPFGIVDLAPISYIITIIALSAGIERYDLFDIFPIEFSSIFRQIPEGIVILDGKGRIIEINSTAIQMLGITERDLIADNIKKYLAPHEIPIPHKTELETERRQTIQRERDGSLNYIDIQCIPMLSKPGKPNGHIMVLSDVTDHKLTEQSLNVARKNINLLTSITRHDILNQLTVIIVHNEILQSAVTDSGLIKSIKELDRAAKNIRRQIEFTKEFQKLGENLPQWIDIQKLFVHHQEDLGYQYILYSIHLEGLEVFADPLIDRVFYNLLQNSVRFGEKVTSIRLFYLQQLDGITIVYEDNGVGIPVKEKSRIFERGSGLTTGFGLFFSKEILSITGITIKETGKAGSGARFEISVPWGKFRLGRETTGSQ